MFKRMIILSLMCVIAFSQCRRKNSSALSEKNLPSEFFDVPVNKDTVIHTSRGAIISIPSGALNAGAATHVKLEVKEAYTIADMVLGGLTTKAGMDLLSSGGMIFINPADNSNVTLSKSISVSIPAAYQQDGMQLYKGQKKDDGTIDWTDPQPLPKQKLSDHLQEGELLYTSNCASCHKPLIDATGPPLALLDKRRDWNWIKHFVRNPSELMATGDTLSNCLYEKYNKVIMTNFPVLNNEQLHAIFDYADYTAANIDPSTIPDFKKSLDSCIKYNKIKQLLENNRQQNEFVVVKHISSVPVHPLDLDSNVTPAFTQSVYYQVNIQTFGWFNIDILTQKLPGFENSELMVRITGKYRDNIKLYMLLPSRKIFLEGGPLSGQTEVYGFYTENGKIPLPQNERVYILAMAERDGQLYFGKTEFITTLKQSPNIQLSPTTKEQMNIEILKLDIKDLTISAADSKNSDAIRKIDIKLSDIEKLRPQSCDCNCGSTVLLGDTASLRESTVK